MVATNGDRWRLVDDDHVIRLNHNLHCRSNHRRLVAVHSMCNLCVLFHNGLRRDLLPIDLHTSSGDGALLSQ